MPQSAEARVATAARRLRCVELASQGLTYAEIAEAVGYANKSSARKAVVGALSERSVEAVEHLRSVESERLDALQASIWDAALAGDIRAVEGALRIINARVNLLGLASQGSGPLPQDQASVVSPAYWEALRSDVTPPR